MQIALDAAVQTPESPMAVMRTSDVAAMSGDLKEDNVLMDTALAETVPEKSDTSMVDGVIESKLATVEADLASATITVLGKQEETVARVVEKGDTLTQLIRNFYGRSGPEMIEAVVRLNPHITNPDYIMAGDTLVFPVARESESGGEIAAAMPGVPPEDRKRP